MERRNHPRCSLLMKCTSTGWVPGVNDAKFFRPQRSPIRLNLDPTKSNCPECNPQKVTAKILLPLKIRQKISNLTPKSPQIANFKPPKGLHTSLSLIDLSTPSPWELFSMIFSTQVCNVLICSFLLHQVWNVRSVPEERQQPAAISVKLCTAVLALRGYA